MEKQSIKQSTQDIESVAKESQTSSEEKPKINQDNKVKGAAAEIETEAVSITRYSMYFAQMSSCI